MTHVPYDNKRLHLQDFATLSTVHCLPEVVRADKRHWKLFWMGIILTAMVAASYEWFMVISRYIKSPLITVHEIVPSNSLPFPTVEICPTHVVNATKAALHGFHPVIIAFALSPLGDTARLTLDGFLTMPNEPYDPDSMAFIVASNVNKEVALAQLDAVMKLAGKPQTPEQLEQIYMFKQMQLQSQFETFVESVGLNSTGRTYNVSYGSWNVEDMLNVIGLDLDKVFLECKFQAHETNCSNIVRQVFDQKYGRCFLVDMQRHQELVGVGLNVLLDLNTDDVFVDFPGLSDGITIRINDEFNPVSFRTIMIPVGAYSSVVLRTTKYDLSTGRGSEICQQDIEREITTFSYSDTVCRLECFHQLSLRRCGCTAALPLEFLKNISSPQCKTMIQMHCLLGLTSSEIMKTNVNCTNQCKPRCSYWEYTPLVSYNSFPSAPLKKKLRQIDIDNVDSWHSNYILLEVAFDELMYNHVRQEESATIDQLAGEIGGHMGLFLGASVLSIVQMCVICCFGGKAVRGGTEQAVCVCCTVHTSRPNSAADTTTSSNPVTPQTSVDNSWPSGMDKQDIYDPKEGPTSHSFSNYPRRFSAAFHRQQHSQK